MRTVFLTVAIVWSAFAADPSVTDGLSNGRAWNGMAEEIKFIYLVGLADGLAQAQGEIIPILFSKPTPGQEEKAAEIIPGLRPTGRDFVSMIVVLDDFYRDAQNLDIPIPMAARFGRAKLEGRDAKQLADTLSRMRARYKALKELDSVERK